MENVRRLCLPLFHTLLTCICSGLRQKRPVVCYFLLFLPESTQIIAQLCDN